MKVRKIISNARSKSLMCSWIRFTFILRVLIIICSIFRHLSICRTAPHRHAHQPTTHNRVKPEASQHPKQQRYYQQKATPTTSTRPHPQRSNMPPSNQLPPRHCFGAIAATITTAVLLAVVFSIQPSTGHSSCVQISDATFSPTCLPGANRASFVFSMEGRGLVPSKTVRFCRCCY